MTSFFGYWCSNCATRVSIETESEQSHEIDLTQDQCPACGAKSLESLDDLLPRGEVPYESERGRRDETDRRTRVAVRAREHAKFLEKRKKERIKR